MNLSVFILFGLALFGIKFQLIEHHRPQILSAFWQQVAGRKQIVFFCQL